MFEGAINLCKNPVLPTACRPGLLIFPLFHIFGLFHKLWLFHSVWLFHKLWLFHILGDIRFF